MCIGCRQRDATAELFRIVAMPGPSGAAVARSSKQDLEHEAVIVSVVPDSRQRMPGRGAWLHPDPDCVALATRRRAFGRALRVPGPVDTVAIEDHVTARQQDSQQDSPTSGPTAGDDEQ